MVAKGEVVRQVRRDGKVMIRGRMVNERKKERSAPRCASPLERRIAPVNSGSHHSNTTASEASDGSLNSRKQAHLRPHDSHQGRGPPCLVRALPNAPPRSGGEIGPAVI